MPTPQRKRAATVAILAGIVAWAAALRLWACHTSPPGLYTDEASNAWNAWCLLHTGHDEAGQRWPIFYTRAFDDFRSPLYLYLLMAFQLIGGLSICTTRLPAAVGGIITVPLLYYIGRRLFDRDVGLVAAGMLAISPWHVQHTRWGHEGTMMPLLVALVAAALLWAAAPAIDTASRWRPWRALLAGIVIGAALYGYAAIRMYLPVALLAAALVIGPAWGAIIRRRIPRQAVLLLLTGFIVITAPLVWTHFTDPHINQRAGELQLWKPGDGLATRVFRIADRYLPHFGISFLFESGDPNPALAPPKGFGCFNWFMLPLLLIGGVTLVMRAASSRSARLLLVLLLTYPAGDLLFGSGTQPHALRGFPGALWLCLAAGVGAMALYRFAARKSSRAGPAIAIAMLIWVGVSHAQFLRTFFGPFNRDGNVIWVRNLDLQEACDWLKPRLDSLDMVFITQEGFVFPYAPTLVFVNHDPVKWFTEPRAYAPGPKPFQVRQICVRFGKIRFITDLAAPEREISELRATGKRVAMILRPDQVHLADGLHSAGEIRIEGETRLLLFDSAD